MDTIKLLDGSEWNVKEILEKMEDNNFYYGFLGKNTLSSSVAKKLMVSADDYIEDISNPKDSDIKPFRDGRLIHVSILESDKINDYYDFVDVASRRNKEFKLAKENSKGKEVMLEKERIWADGLKEVVLEDPEIKEYITKGECEKSGIGYIMGLPFRGKADCLYEDKIIDLKTTSDIDNWEYNSYFYGYDIQSYIYTQLFNKDEFVFVIIDKRNNKLKTYKAPNDFINSGKRKLRRAVENYIEHFGF